MDKEISNINHAITINERKSIAITGVKKITSFNANEFLLDTNMGFITLKGSDLEIVKLDTFQGNVSIKGTINSLSYSENIKKEDSVFNKLFKYNNFPKNKNIKKEITEIKINLIKLIIILFNLIFVNKFIQGFIIIK